jgi:hypothetical protein
MTTTQLMEIGFQRVGDCRASLFQTNLFDVNLVSSIRNTAKLVYAISLDNNVVYVGSTNRGLSRRFTAYRNGTNRETTDGRIGEAIGQALRTSSNIEVLAWIDAQEWQLGWLKVNRYRSVEDAVIESCPDLLWNRQMCQQDSCRATRADATHSEGEC